MSCLLFHHRYPHTSHAFAEQPAPLLKSADAVLFAVAKTLGLHVRFVHLYKLEAGSNEEEDQMAPLSIPGRDYGDCDVPREVVVRADDLQLQLADGFKPVSEISGAVTRERFIEGHVGPSFDDCALVDVLRPMSGVNYVESWTNLCKTDEFRRCFTSMEMERQKDIQLVCQRNPVLGRGQILAYGNESCVNYFYCAAAMLVSIPKWGQDRHKVFERLHS